MNNCHLINIYSKIYLNLNNIIVYHMKYNTSIILYYTLIIINTLTYEANCFYLIINNVNTTVLI